MPDKRAIVQESPEIGSTERRLSRDLRRAESVAKMMDSAIRIPGTRFRFGWDAVVGIVPVVGDVLAALPLFYFLYVGWRNGISRFALIKMAWRQLIDTAIGSIPIVGDLFDIGYKAHVRNAKHLRSELSKRLFDRDWE